MDGAKRRRKAERRRSTAQAVGGFRDARIRRHALDGHADPLLDGRGKIGESAVPVARRSFLESGVEPGAPPGDRSQYLHYRRRFGVGLAVEALPSRIRQGVDIGLDNGCIAQSFHQGVRRRLTAAATRAFQFDNHESALIRNTDQVDLADFAVRLYVLEWYLVVEEAMPTAAAPWPTVLEIPERDGIPRFPLNSGSIGRPLRGCSFTSPGKVRVRAPRRRLPQFPVFVGQLVRIDRDNGIFQTCVAPAGAEQSRRNATIHISESLQCVWAGANSMPPATQERHRDERTGGK